MSKTFHISPGSIARMLFAVITILLLLNLVCVYLKYVMGMPHGFIGTFMFGKESNIPSLYSALALLTCGLVVFAISNLSGEAKKMNKYYWKVIGVVFVFLSMDELFALHEMLTAPTREIIGENASGWFHYAWVVPYMIVFGLIGIFFLRFFFRLPTGTRVRFFIAAFIFLFGAVGMETVAGRYDYYFLPGESDLLLALMVSVEEYLEMSGVIIFLSALVSYYIRHADENTVQYSIVMAKEKKRRVALENINTPVES